LAINKVRGFGKGAAHPFPGFQWEYPWEYPSLPLPPPDTSLHKCETTTNHCCSLKIYEPENL